MTEEEQDSKKQVVIYSDGACEPNPGPGGYGVILMYGKARKQVTGGFRLTTNNRMEVYAAIKGLELLKESCQVTVYSDSRYLVDAMTKGWAVKWKNKNWRHRVNADLWKKLLALTEVHQVEFVWIKGHAGSAENERCDRLSYAALRQQDLPADEGYESQPEETGPIKMTCEGQPCRKCSTPVIKLKSRKFHFYLYCPGCHASYEIENEKAQPEETPTLF